MQRPIDFERYARPQRVAFFQFLDDEHHRTGVIDPRPLAVRLAEEFGLTAEDARFHHEPMDRGALGSGRRAQRADGGSVRPPRRAVTSWPEPSPQVPSRSSSPAGTAAEYLTAAAPACASPSSRQGIGHGSCATSGRTAHPPS